MKIAVKYALYITIGIAIWVLADHFVFHFGSSDSKARLLTPVFFSLITFVMTYLGISAKRREKGTLTFSQGLWTGMSISVAFVLFASLFFLTAYLVVGPRLLENEPAAVGQVSAGYLLLRAIAGLSASSLAGGLVYSFIISFLLRDHARERPVNHKPRRRK